MYKVCAASQLSFLFHVIACVIIFHAGAPLMNLICPNSVLHCGQTGSVKAGPAKGDRDGTQISSHLMIAAKMQRCGRTLLHLVDEAFHNRAVRAFAILEQERRTAAAEHIHKSRRVAIGVHLDLLTKTMKEKGPGKKKVFSV